MLFPLLATWLTTQHVNLLTPNDDYSGRTAPLTSKCCILYIYSTNIGTEYFKHGVYCPFLPLQNAVCFINLTYLVPVLFTFYIQGVLKLKKNSGVKRLINNNNNNNNYYYYYIIRLNQLRSAPLRLQVSDFRTFLITYDVYIMNDAFIYYV